MQVLGERAGVLGKNLGSDLGRSLADFRQVGLPSTAPEAHGTWLRLTCYSR